MKLGALRPTLCLPPKNVSRCGHSTISTIIFVPGSPWLAMGSGVASINISAIRFPALSRNCVPPYAKLAPLANRWHSEMGIDTRFPEEHDDFLIRCHAAGQSCPTPLILRYDAGDYNCLHQDLYGEHVFPLQIAFLLSNPKTDFHGGEFVMTEQRPRMQSRAEVVQLALGQAVIFAVSRRPARGMRGSYRVNMRHGVSRIRSGRRFALGIIFHDAA
jgi:hypothetical protein